jgi:hypothetical protein
VQALAFALLLSHSAQLPLLKSRVAPDACEKRQKDRSNRRKTGMGCTWGNFDYIINKLIREYAVQVWRSTERVAVVILPVGFAAATGPLLRSYVWLT